MFLPLANRSSSIQLMTQLQLRGSKGKGVAEAEVTQGET